MTVNGYVRCGGCGGYLPAGAICGYCLQRQQNPAHVRTPAIQSKPRPTRPARAIVTLATLALVVCAIGAGAVFVAQSVTRATSMANRGAASPVAGLGSADQGGAATLNSPATQEVIAALGSGDTGQALEALSATDSTPTPTLQSIGEAEAPTLPQSSAPSAPVLEVRQGMPDDVRRWLEHLQRIEQARVNLAASQLQEAVKTLVSLQAGDLAWASGDEEGDPQENQRRKQRERTQSVGGEMQNLQTAWRTLSNAFNALPPPAECAGIKANYDQVIHQTGAMMVDIIGQLGAAESNPQAAIAALTSMQGTSGSRIDAPAKAADQGVGSICRKYDTTKWFDIQGDVGAGTLSRLGF